MSEPTRTALNGTTPDDLERSIVQQREELAKTIDALQAKLDVRSRVLQKTEDLRQHPAWLGAGAATLVATVVAAVVLVVWRRRR
jgi:hypothetical protein